MLDGKILLLGSDHDAVTFLHYVEHVANIPDEKIDNAAALAAHEGVHVADGTDWISSGFWPNANLSVFQTERDAYSVGGTIYEGLDQPDLLVQEK